MVALSMDVEEFLVQIHQGFERSTCKVKGYIWEVYGFLFALMVILRPFDLKILLTSFFVFLMRLGFALHTARPLSP